MRRETLRNAGLLLLSTVISLALAEIAVRYFIPVRDVGPSLSVHDPVLGGRIKANFRAERITPEFRMRLSTNSLGFRGPEPDGVPRRAILFLGDSFTLGHGASDGEEFPARIADNVNEKLFEFAAGAAPRELPVPAAGAMRDLQAVIDAIPGLSYSSSSTCCGRSECRRSAGARRPQASRHR